MIKPSITISRAKNSDAHAVQSCARLAYKHYIERMGNEPAPMRVNFSAAVAKSTITVAKIEEELVGFAIHYQQGDSEQLENIAVLPTRQSMGIGKNLLHHIEQESLKNGRDCIELYTNERMHENIAMYKYLGYTETHRMTQDGFARVFFRKKLRSNIANNL